MIDNPDKFQAIITNKRRENQITHKLKIYGNEIETTKSVKLLGIEIDNQLSLNQRISNLCIYLFIYLLIYWFIDLSICWFIDLIIYLFICSVVSVFFQLVLQFRMKTQPRNGRSFYIFKKFKFSLPATQRLLEKRFSEPNLE